MEVRNRRGTRQILLAASMATIGAVFVPEVFGDRGLIRAQADETLVVSLEAFRGELRRLGSLRLRSRVHIVMERQGSGTTSGAGSYEYLEDGGHYRIESKSDPHLGLIPNQIFAYDGRSFGWLDGRQRLLSISTADTRNNPASLPNPLFLLLDFFDPSQEACGGCRLRLSDLEDETRWTAIRGSLFRYADDTLEVRKAMPSGRMLRHRIVFAAPALAGTASPEVWPIARVERLNDAGAVQAMFVVNARDAAGLPRHITATVRNLSGRTVMEASFAIDVLERGTALPASSFSIDPSLARTVWHSDSLHWTKIGGKEGVVRLEEVSPLAAKALRAPQASAR